MKLRTPALAGGARVANYELRISFALFAVIFLSACAPSSEIKPPDIAYGRDVCAACGMIISEARFAAATLMADGKMLQFDDVGDMVIHHAQQPQLQVRAYFVHDYNSKAWIRGETAFYVIGKEKVRTPMGHGVAAFEAREAAETLAKSVGAPVLTFEELKVAVK